jgi:hypothetical protein
VIQRTELPWTHWEAHAEASCSTHTRNLELHLLSVVEMDAKNPLSTFDPSLPMSAYESYNMTDNLFGESTPNRASRDPREFLPIANWNEFVFDQGMGGLDTSDLPPLPLLEQEQPPSFLGNDHALPLYNTGTQFPFPNQDHTDVAQLSLSSLSDPQGETGTDGSVEKTNSETASEVSTPKKRKPRRKKNPLSEKEKEEKHNKFLDRNRKAAQKCREKKKGWVENLQGKFATLQRDYDRMIFERAEMAKELEICKQFLADHTACGVPSMNSWVNDMSRSGSISMGRNLSSQSRVSISMDRNLSSQSRTSQNSSSSFQKDSGISNMGTPPDERRNVKQPHEDEGFSDAMQFGQGQQYIAQPKVPMLHNPMVPMVGPSDLQNPAEFLARMGVHRPM